MAESLEHLRVAAVQVTALLQAVAEKAEKAVRAKALEAVVLALVLVRVLEMILE